MEKSTYYMLNQESRFSQLGAGEAACIAISGRDAGLRRHFEQAQKTGADLLIYSYAPGHAAIPDDPTLSAGETTVRIRDGHVPSLPLEALICSGRPICAVYDLKKPFDQARGGEELLPPTIKQAIRAYRYGMIRHDLPLWQRLLFICDRRRLLAFQQTLPVIL